MSEEKISITQIAKIIAAKTFLTQPSAVITSLLTDSRTIINAPQSLFFAVVAQRNGHDFVAHAYQSGVRNFVISNPAFAERYKDANFLVVNNVLQALQQLAIYKRNLYQAQVIGITGSNGKTIVKEWLNQLLAADFNIVRSPKSYNSQIGVPLSVWQINNAHNLAIFEAGISTTNEMEALLAIIKPTIGILTNIGQAHAEGFKNEQEKLKEKLKLFKNTSVFIYSPLYTKGINQIDLPGTTKFTWGYEVGNNLQILVVNTANSVSKLTAIFQNQEIECTVPFLDKASIENAVICWATLLALNYTPHNAAKRLAQLTAVSMRLVLKNGINQCSVIDDSYSADISSLAIALDFLNLQNQHAKKTLILSDLYQTGKANEALYTEIAALLSLKKINRLIGIGLNISAYANKFKIETTFFNDTAAFVANFNKLNFANETILVKGARLFEFEQISKLLTQKTHQTVLEISLNALAANLQFYKNQLQPKVMLMAMVKAFSYGSGSFEIANLLQYHKVNYLAVAYADEGIDLRNAGITLPIMVMSPEPAVFDAMLKNNLEPEIYSFEILNSFLNFLPANITAYPIHLKLDTGMNRLGFLPEELPEIIKLVIGLNKIKITSVFTHLVASGDKEHDEFTQQQILVFTLLCQQLTENIGYQPIRHILNTNGITRWPNAQLDMVRIGIGLYGFDTALNKNYGLQTVAVLKTTVTQVKNIKHNQTVGYGRKGLMPTGGKVATVKIGYADGYHRSFGNGVGKMLINGKLVNTIGAICMDMCMLDVTGLPVKSGDEVIVFNEILNIAHLAEQINTIPYEILTNISQRVKRVYFYE